MMKYLKTRGRGEILALTAFVFLFSLALCYGEAQAASTGEARAALVEGARKEGKVVFYTAMAVGTTAAVIDRFQQKYPFIKVELYRANNINVSNRISVEAKANRRINDVVIATGDIVQALKEGGFLAPYLSPEREFYPEGFKDKEGYWTDSFLTVHSLAYNTNLVPRQEVPVKYRDLLHPRWKGKVGINLNNFMWTKVITEIMGEREGLEFLKALARQNPVARKGGTLTVLLVAAGELSLAVSVNANNVEDVKAKGAPVDWAKLQEPHYAELHPAALNALAPHPNAAKLFIDFALSQEGQELIVKFNSTSSRRGVRAPFFKAEEIRPLAPVSRKETLYYEDLIRKIFAP